MVDLEKARCCLEQVDCCFPNGTQALRNVTLDLSEHKFTAIIGPSGAGKSTLIRVLNGLVRPTAGKVWLNGFEMSSASNVA
ncbi:MAG TPA: ATP-binding cassette domain-containing protein, partial [Dehalococcoidia bacterium]|nr:ATP-binding cassette domain-containing protein [Dehalococcoidia bacterium]